MFQILIKIAQQLLKDTFSLPCKINAYDQLSVTNHRNVILRLHLDSSAKHLPKSVILKQSLPDADSVDENETLSRFSRDWAGIEFLSLMKHTGHFTPRFYGGSIEHRFILLEDLGKEHISLVNALTSSNPKEAISALTRFTQTLAGMHIASFGHLDQYESILKRIHPKNHNLSKIIQSQKEYLLPLLKSTHQILGLTTNQAVIKEAKQLIETIFTPGPFTVLTHGDICPDNVFDHQASRDMQLIDFEYASPRHALLDGTYLRMSMPTCWCAKAIPTPIINVMETIYQQKLATVIPEANNNIEYEKAFVLACGFWILQQTLHFIEGTLIQDRLGPSGQTSTDSLWNPQKNWVRPRVLSRLKAFINISSSTTYLPQLTLMAKNILAVLTIRWPETKSLEFYPAFQNEKI